jgi:hypothetical protein
VYKSIEEQLAAAGLSDEEMEDAGDEGAIDTLSEEDDSGLLGEDEDGSEAEDDAASTQKSVVVNQESQVSSADDGEDDEPEEEVHDANQRTKVVDLDEDQEAALEAATKQLEIDRETVAAQQKADAFKMLSEGWNRSTIELYMLMDRRTIEPLMPIGWRSDFELFPWSIWSDSYQDAFLAGTRPEDDYIVIKATRDLLKLPVHVRNQIRIKAWYGRRAEAMVVKYCEDYMKLVHRDCRLFVPLARKKLVSLICYAPGDEKTPVNELEVLMLQRLRKRASKVLDLLRLERWKKALSKQNTMDDFEHEGQCYLVEPPTLYGIVAKEAVIALVAYEPLSPRDALRTIAFFHMSKATYDVWNALALAIVMVQCRNELLKIKAAIPEDLDALEMSDSDEDA